MVIFLGGSAMWIWDDQLPSTTAAEIVILGIGFCAASLLGSWIAWRLRLSDSLGPITSIAFWVVFVLVMCAVPLMAVRLSEGLGPWVFCVWSVIGSYTWGFLQLNTRLPNQYAG